MPSMHAPVTHIQAYRRGSPRPGETHRRAAQCGACSARWDTPWRRMRRHGRYPRMVCPRTLWGYGQRRQGERAVTGSCRTREAPHQTRAPCQVCAPSTARSAGHGQHAPPVHWSLLSLPSWTLLGAATVQRPGLPVPSQHHVWTLADYDHHARREERPRSCHDDAPPTSPRAPRCFTGGGWCGWAACSAP
jgi:hypothetical protein